MCAAIMRATARRAGADAHGRWPRPARRRHRPGHAAGGQQPLDHELHLLLAGMAGADHAFLDVVGGIFGDLQPGLRRRQQRHGAGMADLERGRGIRATKACSTAMAHGRMALDHRASVRGAGSSAARPGPSAGLVAITPWAIWESRVPDISITPQPMGRGRDQDRECESRGSWRLFVRFMFRLSGLRSPGADLAPAASQTRLALFKREPGVLRASLSGIGVGQFVIAIDVLHVVMVVQHFDQLHQRLAGLVGHRAPCSAAATRWRRTAARPASLPAHRARRRSLPCW